MKVLSPYPSQELTIQESTERLSAADAAVSQAEHRITRLSLAQKNINARMADLILTSGRLREAIQEQIVVHFSASDDEFASKQAKTYSSTISEIERLRLFLVDLPYLRRSAELDLRQAEAQRTLAESYLCGARAEAERKQFAEALGEMAKVTGPVAISVDDAAHKRLDARAKDLARVAIQNLENIAEQRQKLNRELDDDRRADLNRSLVLSR